MIYEDQAQFLTELSQMFATGRENGKSVWITMKRYDGRTKRNPRKPNDKPKDTSKTPICDGDLHPKEYKCLVRAKLGNKRISCAVAQKDLPKFQTTYSNLLKENISNTDKR